MLILLLLLIPITILENANILPSLLVVSSDFKIGISFLIRSIILLELIRYTIKNKGLSLKATLAIAFVVLSIPFYVFALDVSGMKMLSVLFYFLTTFSINIIDFKYLKNTRKLLDIIGVFITISAILEFLRYEGLQGRTFGIAGDEYATIVLFYILINYKRNWLLFALHVLGLLLTGSIGVLIGVTLTWLILVFRRFRITSIRSIVAAGVVFLVIYNLNTSWSQRLVDQSAMNSLQLRLASFQIAQELLSDYWLLGVGIGNYSSIAQSSSLSKFLAPSIWGSPYNQTLKIIIEFGLIGLFFWIRWIRDILRKSFRSRLSPYDVYLFFLFIGIQSAVYLLPASLITIYISYSFFQSNRSK